jgi:hypothetical protein
LRFEVDPTIKAEMDDESAHALTTGSRIASRSATRAARLNLTTMGRAPLKVDEEEDV